MTAGATTTLTRQTPTTMKAAITKATKDIRMITMMASTMNKGLLARHNNTRASGPDVAATTLRKTRRHSATSQ